MSSFESQREIVQRYVERAAPKAAVTPRIQALADQITQGVEGPQAQAQALFDWVAREINYAGNCVGIGAVVPRDLPVVLDNRMGDCKDHATLLQALLQSRGIASHQVLVNAGSMFNLPPVPVVSMVNHVINYVPSLGLFLDSTDSETLFGDLPVTVQDKPVLAAADGVPARTPKEPGRASQQVKAVYRIAADGSFQGEVKLQAQGRFGQQMRVGLKALNKDQFGSGCEAALRGLPHSGGGPVAEDPRTCSSAATSSAMKPASRPSRCCAWARPALSVSGPSCSARHRCRPMRSTR